MRSIARGKRLSANEFLSYNKFEREVQGTSKKAPAYEKVLAYFLRKRGVRSAVVPANFPLGYARELAANKIRLRPTNGLFWPEREAKNAEELRLMRRALAITEKGMARAMEVLRASKPKGKKLVLVRQTADIGNSARGNRHPRFCAPAVCPQTRSWPEAIRLAIRTNAALGPLLANSLIILDIFPRDAASGYFGDMTRTVVRGRASDKQRNLWETVRDGPGNGVEENETGRGRTETAQRKSKNFSLTAVIRPKCARAGKLDFSTEPAMGSVWKFTNTHDFKRQFSNRDRFDS